MPLRLYWDTLRYLRPVQFYARAKLILFKRNYLFINFGSDIPRLRRAGAKWIKPLQSNFPMLGPRSFNFLNKTHTLPLIGGWNEPALEKLWLYNLHYFDYFNVADTLPHSEWHIALLDKWITENPCCRGVGWEPYPTSLRIVNWIKWALRGGEISNKGLQSLVTQSNYLMSHLEWHLLGNHLFSNAKALVFAGLFFDGLQPELWLKKGLKIISKQLPEQVLIDGGNFERSPMYHSLFLQDLLDLINIAETFTGRIDINVVTYWRHIAKKMLCWLEVMTHQDGKIALFNDAAFGIAPEYTNLSCYASSLGVDQMSLDDDLAKSFNGLSLTHLKDSGYITISSKNAKALLDVAPIGPDYLPGHAHADTLSFEASIFSQRVIVNGGTSCYGTNVRRHLERETSSHSTVEVDGKSSSEVWGGFRVARRARPFDLGISVENSSIRIECSHDGYKRLDGNVVHVREWIFGANELSVFDEVKGGGYNSIARFILHPDIQVYPNGDNCWILKLSAEEDIEVFVLKGHGMICPSSYSPEFGKIIPTKCIFINLVEGQSRLKLSWK
jgi:uncharacterized heparinase superfamily protein